MSLESRTVAAVQRPFYKYLVNKWMCDFGPGLNIKLPVLMKPDRTACGVVLKMKGINAKGQNIQGLPHLL